jgi:septal ring factor EnvC (AmiA/AmiB activator)
MATPITRTEAIRAAQQTMIDAERRRIEAVEAEARATLDEVADLRARLAEAHAERDQLAAQLAALRRWVAAMPRQEATCQR